MSLSLIKNQYPYLFMEIELISDKYKRDNRDLSINDPEI